MKKNFFFMVETKYGQAPKNSFFKISVVYKQTFL